jgi:stage II sporulation protein D
MRYFCKILSILFLISGNTVVYAVAEMFDFPIQLMVSTREGRKKHQHGWWTLFSEHGFVIQDKTKDKHCLLRKNRSLLIRYDKGRVYINGALIHNNDIYIYPISGSLIIDNQQIYALRIHQVPDVGIVVAHYGTGRVTQPTKILNWSPTNLVNLSLPDISFDSSTDITSAGNALPLHVRVLLDEQKTNAHVNWIFIAPVPDSRFIVIAADGMHRKKIIYKERNLSIMHKNDHFYINGKRVHGTQLFVESCKGHITFGNNTYKGLLWLAKQEKDVMVINCLDIEDYVHSVLRTESWPGWPLEINKVLAIASRTYAVSMVINAKRSKRLYHVKNTNEHQTYSGIHTCAIIKCAVEETRGVFLSHENKPIVAMFDSCCGGVIPAHIDGVNFDDAPYLAREYACNYCKRCKIYSWQAAYLPAELETAIQKYIPTFKKLRTINIVKNDKAGLVQEALVHGLEKSTITGKKLYSLLPAVKSFCFSVKQHQEKIIFEGRGYGHHLGLCQWGAREMVRDGWDYRRILQFYYPNTDFMRLM